MCAEITEELPQPEYCVHGSYHDSVKMSQEILLKRKIRLPILQIGIHLLIQGMEMSIKQLPLVIKHGWLKI